MKKLLILLFIFLSIRSLAQPKLPCAKPIIPGTQKPTSRGEIDPKEAYQRMDVYRFQKNQNELTDAIKYDPCGFLDLLNKLNNSEKRYSGLRIYLATDSVNIKQLMLIFVPTTYEVDNGIGIHKDDTSAIYKILNNKAVIIGRTEASTYIRSFQNHHTGNFNTDGRSVLNNAFEETTNLWYDIALFREGTDPYSGTTGMQGVLQYLIDNNQVNKVIINLAAFNHTATLDFYYHIMLLFSFYQNQGQQVFFTGENSVPLNLAFNSFLDKNKNLFNLTKQQSEAIGIFLASFGFIDTGVPCPPPPPNKTCGQIGAALP